MFTSHMIDKLQGCCSDTLFIDWSKMGLVDTGITWDDWNLWSCILVIVLPPLLWNMIARYEYRTHTLSRLIGDPKLACSILAAFIFLATSYKSYRFNMMMASQPRCIVLHETWILWMGYLLIYTGFLLVISSFMALGFFGTYLGDYFGILMEEKVTGFPFNIVNNPMYVGSTLNFAGFALVKASSAGLFLTAVVAIVYYVAILFEGPFTEEIYRKKEKRS